MASFVYGPGAHALIVGAQGTNPIAWLTNTIKCGLSTSTHVPDKDDEFLDDVEADDFTDGELSGTGYSAGGITLSAGKAITYDTTNDRVEIDSSTDPQWTGIDAGTAAQATVYDSVGGAYNADRMICNVDTGGFPVVTNGGDLTITWNAEGIVQLTV
jgi:hypothetical protein